LWQYSLRHRRPGPEAHRRRAVVRISSVTTPRSALYEQPDVLTLELGELI